MTGRKIALVLFNLGGPGRQEDVKPFLFNLFNDPAIIGLPGFLRTPLARRISARRESVAQTNYALIGGGSPLLAETRKQAEALQARLADRLPDAEVRTFVAMRYWTPLVADTAAEVAAFAPDEVVLLPLYPQFSTTTTGSSLTEWRRAYRGTGVERTVCCYPDASGWIEAQADIVRAGLEQAAGAPVRVLFSAHGIPERLVTKKGDPYQEQVETTAAAIATRLGLTDWTICYQSRVGPMRWLGPSTPEAIEQAARDGVGVVVAPIAFVSEHVETLVELDIEYAELARELGVVPYIRVPAVGTAPAFIDGLAEMTIAALARDGVAPAGAGCQADWRACPRRAAMAQGAAA